MERYGSDKKGKTVEKASKRASEHTGFNNKSSSSKSSSAINKIQNDTFSKVKKTVK